MSRRPLRRQLNARGRALFGIDKLNVAALGDPGGDPCRLFGAHTDRPPRDQPALSCAARAFKDKTGCPVLVNTSFNVRGEPIAHTPEDAFRCLMGTEIEMLVIGNCVLSKKRQNPNLVLDYRNAFDPD